MCKYKQYYELKIKNYIMQDVNAGRIKLNKENQLLFKDKVIDNYINYEWIKSQDFKCYICNELFDIDLIDSKVSSNMTVDRIDNRLPHIKHNCKLCCIHCNISKK